VNATARSIIVLLLLGLWGCAGVFTRPGPDGEAAALLEKAGSADPGLRTLKGLATVDILRSGKHYQARLAWICEPPDRFRITVLGALGRPSLSLTSDGRQFFYLSHDSGEFKKWQRGAMFTPLTMPIAVAPEDIAAVLSGRIPTRAHDSASVTPREPDGGRVLVLKRWGRIVQTIDFDPEGGGPVGYTVYTAQNTVDYSVSFQDLRQVAGYRLPWRSEIDGGNGSRVTVRVDRYWPNSPVNPEMFVLAPS